MLNARHRTRGSLNAHAKAVFPGPRDSVVTLAIVILVALSVASTLAGFVLGWSP